MLSMLLLSLTLPVVDGEPKRAELLDVTIKAPGITCASRFKESLEKKIVAKHAWIRSVKIEYKPNEPKLPANDPLSWGQTATLKFRLKRNSTRTDLAKLLVKSGLYYGADRWLMNATPLGKLAK